MRKLSVAFQTIKATAHAKFRAFKKDTQGIAAIEFVILAPIMFGIYIGVTVTALAISADRNVSHATNVIGDLATQDPSHDAASLGNIMTAAIAVLGPGTTDEYTIELLSYRKVAGAAELIGEARLGPAIGAYDTTTLLSNTRLFNDTSGVVVARIQYKYELLIREAGDLKLNETFILKPRKSADVPFGTGLAGGNTFTNCTKNTGGVVTC